MASPCPRLARQTPSKSASSTSDGHGMSFNFAQLFDRLSRAVFRSGQSLLIVCIENAFISFVAYVHGYLCDRMPQIKPYLLSRFVCQSAAPRRAQRDSEKPEKGFDSIAPGADGPKLGQLNRREVAALVGVAPFNRDNGSCAPSICRCVLPVNRPNSL